MTIITGIKDATYLAQFLGKKIAIQDEQDKNKYYIYPILHSINMNHEIIVIDSKLCPHTFPWERCESPYVILMDHEVILK